MSEIIIPDRWSLLELFTKILSMSVLDVEHMRVGLVMDGYKKWENELFRKHSVPAWLLIFSILILKSPAIINLFFVDEYLWRNLSYSVLNTS